MYDEEERSNEGMWECGTSPTEQVMTERAAMRCERFS